MGVGILVITLSWLLNAAMDAIDHGKGAQRLGFLWHILKWFSYALPFGYIMWLTHMTVMHIFTLVVVLWGMWELAYRYLRSINFYKWDV